MRKDRAAYFVYHHRRTCHEKNIQKHQSIKASKHQSIKASKHQSIKASKHQSIKASKHQSIKASIEWYR
ncbi:TPA: hypothetical protein QHP34_004075 [Citrobacter braakii]|nr:hypothetical protein [Citrobacter braakii]